jgi:chromosome segregation ATPase
MTEIVKINPAEFGLKETEVATIEAAFMPKIVERDGLKSVYEEILTKEITPALCSEAKSIRLKLVKVRTGIAEIHKSQKAFFLAAGRFVDAWKNKETLPVTQMEENLDAIEKHYEKIEAEKIMALQESRKTEIAKYQAEGAFIPDNLGTLTEEVYNNYLLGVKTAHDQKIKAEQEAKEAEEKRIAAEKAEQERVKKENEQLKKEAEEKEAALKAEREKAEAALRNEREEKERMQRELDDKAAAEKAAAEKAEMDKQTELSKGDAEKVKDLIVYLESAKTKFSFKSKKNVKMYSDVCILIDKIINHIEK